MSGKRYSNGFYATAITDINGNAGNSAFYTLAGKYKTLTFMAGAVDNQLSPDSEFRIYADDKPIKTIEIKTGSLPKKYILNIDNALQLKTEMCANVNWASVGEIGMADIILN